MEKNSFKGSFKWGPPVHVYTLNKLDFDLIKLINPDITHTQGKDMEFDGVEIINSRYGYNNNNREKIIDILRKYFRDYIIKATGRNIEFKCKNKALWVNEYHSNYFINPHIHVDCDISFILYIKSNQDILENDPQNHAGCTVFQYGEGNDSRAIIPNIWKHFHKPIDGELVVFPNNISHYTVPFKSPNIKRWTLSGNLSLSI